LTVGVPSILRPIPLFVNFIPHQTYYIRRYAVERVHPVFIERGRLRGLPPQTIDSPFFDWEKRVHAEGGSQGDEGNDVTSIYVGGQKLSLWRVLMTSVILEYYVNERDVSPKGIRVYEDGRVERPAPDAPPPAPTERLDRGREVPWVAARQLSETDLNSLKKAVRESGFFALEGSLLINYCKDDPPAALWLAALEGETHRVVLWDPRPGRNAVIDGLLRALETTLG